MPEQDLLEELQRQYQTIQPRKTQWYDILLSLLPGYAEGRTELLQKQQTQKQQLLQALLTEAEKRKVGRERVVEKYTLGFPEQAIPEVTQKEIAGISTPFMPTEPKVTPQRQATLSELGQYVAGRIPSGMQILPPAEKPMTEWQREQIKLKEKSLTQRKQYWENLIGDKTQNYADIQIDNVRQMYNDKLDEYALSIEKEAPKMTQQFLQHQLNNLGIEWRALNEAYTKKYGTKKMPSKETIIPQGIQSKEDKQALEWANTNPTDPRAKEIKKRLGR